MPRPQTNSNICAQKFLPFAYKEAGRIKRLIKEIDIDELVNHSWITYGRRTSDPASWAIRACMWKYIAKETMRHQERILFNERIHGVSDNHFISRVDTYLDCMDAYKRMPKLAQEIVYYRIQGWSIRDTAKKLGRKFNSLQKNYKPTLEKYLPSY